MKKILTFFCLLSVTECFTFALSQEEARQYKVMVKWEKELPAGRIDVLNGTLNTLYIREGKGNIRGNEYKFRSSAQNMLELVISEAKTGYGSNATLVSVVNGEHSFTFFLRDVTGEYPIFIPDYNVIVSPGHDTRTYSQTATEIKRRALQTKLQEMETEPEESYESAAAHTRNQTCPLLLGLSRDIRIFKMAVPEEMEVISPLLASSPVMLPETDNTSADYCYLAGRGQGVEQKIYRRLEDGVLPILHSTYSDEEIVYEITAFASNESSPLDFGNSAGTHFLVADNYSYGHTFTEEQADLIESLLREESMKNEETVLYLRAVATNTSLTPRYAYFRTLRPGSGWWEKYRYDYDRETGFSAYSANRVFGISKLDGKPLPDEEISILLLPGESASFQFYLPHKPVSHERALKLSRQSFDSRLDECRNFWKEKLSKAAGIRIPEKRIDEMIRAGLLHLDLITYGLEPQGVLAACPGVYSPIGSESSPIIQFYCSMGLHDVARRSLMFFLDKQYDDGMIQSFGGYMIETGAALYTIGEYFRYTRDTAWIRQIQPRLLKSCEFLIKWREKNLKKDLEGRGYGMVDGKVADPNDPYHQFMLNGYGYAGLKRMAEVLRDIDPEASKRLETEAESWKKDIRASLYSTMATSPVIPLGDGTWCPTVPPWTEAQAPRLLYFKPESFLSHGTFTISDALLGPLNLIFCEVLDPEEDAARMMLNYHSELFYQRNTAFSQPYYSRHDWVQISQGLIKPFLKTYYNALSALADRDTYTFWEHLYHVSVHKTHEEAWFLMQTRWMLYMEEEETLKLLPGIPRKWMENGNEIEIGNAFSYFGPFSLSVRSELDKGYIEASLEFSPERMPKEIILRIPHPESKIPSSVCTGVYDRSTESVVLKPSPGKTVIRIEY